MQAIPEHPEPEADSQPDIVPMWADLNLDQIKDKIGQLLRISRSFKFTGGEPTLNPDLPQILKLVKDAGGIVYLDSNCSKFPAIKRMIDDGLVDVLGISLKGLTPEEAVECSGVGRSDLCWHNVMDTIFYAVQSKVVETIVTYVCFEDFTYKRLYDFASLLEDAPNITLKLNNFQQFPYPVRETRLPADEGALEECLLHLLRDKPAWSGRLLLIRNAGGVSNASLINRY